FSLAEDTDDLFVGKTLLHGDVLMWLMKTLLTSRCINQRGAGQNHLMLDLETLGKKASATILTIGAVLFYPRTG
ncbi:3'-5' exoribonuclease domain-containing protein, partial [Serratia marcescens]|uniref:3'-5' exoribonuclease domain-containing protein n=1 Tax=Serratia marcescens TaxID=615 RepID=UPI0027E3D2B4